MTDQATLERVLPATGEDESAKRRQIIDGARAVFLSRGFDAASMNDIAPRRRRLQGHALRLLPRQGASVRGDCRTGMPGPGGRHLRHRSRRSAVAAVLRRLVAACVRFLRCRAAVERVRYPA